MNNPWLVEQRLLNKTLKKLPDTCSRCTKAEASGLPSRRTSVIQYYTLNNIELNDQDLINLDYNCQRVCNLKCITCNGQFSSSWIEDEKALGIFVNPDVIKVKHNTLIDELDLSQVLKVHFNGGEPFMSNDHIAIMKRIVDHNNAGRCDISYNTNGTFLPKQEVIDLWKNFKTVKIFFSIDAIGPAFEYIRYPGKWNQILDNIQWWKQLSEACILLEFNVALGMHNVLYVNDLVDWIENNVESNYFGDPAHISVQLVGHPSLQIENLPENKKQQADQQLALLSGYAWAHGARKELQKPSNNNWQQWLNQLDTIRGTSWRHSLSRLV